MFADTGQIFNFSRNSESCVARDDDPSDAEVNISNIQASASLGMHRFRKAGVLES